jgi:hypothetical protein
MELPYSRVKREDFGISSTEPSGHGTAALINMLINTVAAEVGASTPLNNKARHLT